MVALSTESLQGEATVDEIHKYVKLQLQRDDNVKLMKDIKTKIGDTTARGLVWTTVKEEKGEKKMVVMRVIFIRDKTLYKLTAVCDEDRYAGLVDELDKLMKNISFVE